MALARSMRVAARGRLWAAPGIRSSSSEGGGGGGKRWAEAPERRRFMEQLEEDMGIKEAADWRKVKASDVTARPGGAGLLSRYNNSLLALLRDVYPEREYEEEVCRPRMSRGYWLKQENRRAFLEKVRQEMGVREVAEWARVSVRDVKEKGGKGLLAHYDGSLLAALHDIYPEEAERLRQLSSEEGKFRRRGHWASLANRRRLMDAVAAKHRVEQAEDWKRVLAAHVYEEEGGRALLRTYGDSMSALLQATYPELGMDADGCRAKMPQGYWQSQANRRAFMVALGEAEGLREAKDWQKLSQADIHKRGGSGLLWRFSGSIRKVLEDAFPEMDVAECRPYSARGHWDVAENRRKFMDEAKKALGVEKSRDWAKVRFSDLAERPGGSSVMRRYGNNVLRALQDVYPEEDIDEHCRPNLPADFWTSRERREREMRRIAGELRVTSMEGWKGVTLGDIQEAGGSKLMLYYKNSVFAAIQDLAAASLGLAVAVREEEMYRWRHSLPASFWDKEDHVVGFIKSMEKELQMTSHADWARVAKESVRQMGGSGLLLRYDLSDALKLAYPNAKWDDGKDPVAKRAAQWMLRQRVAGVFGIEQEAGEREEAAA